MNANSIKPTSKLVRRLLYNINNNIRKFSASSTSEKKKPKISVLDLRKSGISIHERLCIEEALLRHDSKKRCWAILGTHEPFHNRLISTRTFEDTNGGGEADSKNENCAIILGIGGKPEKLLNLQHVKEDNVLCIKRFTGGGTVVVDDSSLFTTFIGRTDILSDVKPYPRDIMQWSSDEIFQNVFEGLNLDVSSSKSEQQQNKKKGKSSLVIDTKSCGFQADSSGKLLSFPNTSSSSSKISHLKNNPAPEFSLRENDYVLNLEKKMGGNAQTIAKDGWLHHTSFLWDYDEDFMKRYLQLPSKRPDYRKDKSHDDFLVKLKTHYEVLGRDSFLEKVKAVVEEKFEVVEVVRLNDALELINDELGSMQEWYDGKCRTKVIKV